MVRVLLRVGILFLFLHNGANAQSPAHEDSLKITKQKIAEGKIAVDSIKRSNETIYILKESDHNILSDYLVSAIPIVISLLMLAVTWNSVRVSRQAVDVSERALRISEDALRVSNEALIKERTNKQLDIISTIDNKLTDSPHLWAIYDLHALEFPKAPDGMTSEELNASLNGFCHFHLNSFEMVFRHPSNEDDKRVWENYLVNTIVESTRFRKIVARAIKMYIYNDPYQVILKRLAGIANEILPIFEEYKNGKKTEDEYYAAAKLILDKADRKY